MSELWRPISQEEVRSWRKVLPKGWRREDSVYQRPDLPVVDHEGDTATVRTSKPVGHLEARDTVDQIVKEIMDWLTADRETLQAKIQTVKRAGGLSHLSDDEAIRQMRSMAEKLARDSAQRVYKKEGWDRPVTIPTGGDG